MNATVFLADFVGHCLPCLAADLGQVEYQKARTTKHERRERALAYLLDTLTAGIFPWAPDSAPTRLARRDFLTEERVQAFFALTAALRRSPSKEVQTAAERSERRLSHYLEQLATDPPLRCLACSEALDHRGQPHDCTNASARAKDSAMNRGGD